MRKLALLYCLIISGICIAQSTNLYPYQNKNGFWGFMNLGKQIVIEAEYEYCSTFQYGYSITKKDDQWIILDSLGKKTAINNCDSIQGQFATFREFSHLSCYDKPALRAYRNGQRIHIGIDGYKINEDYCRTGDEDVEEDYFFIKSLPKKITTQEKDGVTKYGFDNRKTNIPTVYDSIIPWFTEVTKKRIYKERIFESTGNELVFLVKSAGKFGMLSQSGDTTIPIIYDKHYFRSYKNEIWFLRDGIWKLFNTNGQLIFDHNFTIDDDLNKKLLIVSNNNGYGIIDRLGKLILQPINEKIYRASYNYIVVERKDSTFLYNSQLELLQTYFKVKDLVYSYSNKAFISKKNNKYGLLSVEGGTILNYEYSKLGLIPNSTNLYFSRNKKQGVISKQGKILMKPKYDEILKCFGDYYFVHKGKTFLYVHENGTEFN